MGASLIRLLGAFALVIAVLLAGVWLARNWRRVAARGTTSRRLQVLEMRALGHRQSLVVVGYEDRRMLLASSPTGVSLLAHLPAAEAGAAPDATAPPGVAITFADAFHGALERRA